MDILGFVAMLTATQAHMEHENKEALDHAGEYLQEKIKENIGTYNLDWPPLSPETVAKKGADTPLLETGALRNSIEHQVVDHDAVEVGTNDEKAKYHELGTDKIPPRSFLVGTAVKEEEKLVEMLGAQLKSAPLLTHKG